MPARTRRAAARTAPALTALALPLTAGLAGAGAAQAAPVPTGSFNWLGDMGNGESDGGRWYDSNSGDTFDATASADHRTLRIAVNRPGDNWTLDFAAPAGQTLAVGSYADAVRVPEMPGVALDRPALFVNGYHGGCAALTGSFTIQELVFGADGRTVEKFKASYAQDCDDRSELTGSISLSGGQAPPKPVALGISVASAGKLTKDGKATLNGTVTCTKPVKVNVTGSARQEQPQTVLGFIRAEVDCVPGKKVPWKSEVFVHMPEVGTPLLKGRTTVQATAGANDPDTGAYVISDTRHLYVTLKR
ncbi:hypothetical protein ACFV7Q_14315 [Streptomyces sp. NPDC059851]|uniref:hypothetical protein n=1 Tax=Streptomyces sp. NPDC059851 TaxID=3346971 RepID=UPI003652A675